MSLRLSLLGSKDCCAVDNFDEISILTPAVTISQRSRVFEACIELPSKPSEATGPVEADSYIQSQAVTPAYSFTESVPYPNVSGLDSEFATSVSSSSIVVTDHIAISSDRSSIPVSVEDSIACSSSKPVATRRKREKSNADYYCELCQKQLLTSSNFGRHMREKHEKLKYACGDCGRDFSRKDYLDKHRMNLGACRKRQVRNARSGR